MKVKFNCKFCKKQFEDYSSAERVYCSRECFILNTRRKEKICGFCGKRFHPLTNTFGKFCSRRCSAISHRDLTRQIFKKWRDEHNNGHSAQWKGGKPRCVNCGKRLSKYDAKRCRKCFLGYKGMSKLEKKVEKIIFKYGLPYKFVGNGKFMIENKCPDFVNTNGEKRAVEVYWKAHKDKFRKSGVEGWKRERKEIFGRYGWEVIFIEGSRINERKVVESLREVSVH